MKEKKGQPQAQDSNNRVQTNIETDIEAIPNHAHQQHNTESQYQQYFEYGFRPPEHHYYATYQQTNYLTHSHIHQKHPLPYQNIQPSQQFEDSNGASMHQNYLPATQKHTHLHQIYNNSQAQKIHQPNQPLSHVHNPIIQRNPPIWEPHQPPPVHYHQQRPSTEEVQKPTAQQTKAKASEVVGRKKLVGSSSHHRSPSAKRPPEAPVTMQGWLNKQGSEGLMLWKKRWFVLSEYCLFYYKGPEEEKLLGSILLPSYEVSICKPEEKISKKYVFKCEHVNMRTYMLAADSQELMVQWVRALTAACTLQISKETETHSDISGGFSQQATIVDNFEPSVNPQFYNESLNTTYVPVQSDQSTCNTDRSLSRLEQHQYYQPLYANAPPKPRRISDHFSSPSPDILDRYTPSQYIETTHGTHNIVDSMPAYSPSLSNTHPAYSQQLCSKYMMTPNTDINNISNTERRTPDSYGRSKFTTRNIPHPQPTGYENIYSDQIIYQRPLSPITYRNVPTKPKPQPILINRLGPNEVTPRVRKQPSNFVTRPHSADFLEYEISHNQSNANTLSKQPPRPKSSIDIYRNTSDSDNYFYSEERYVEKMRTSAQYLHKLPTRMKNDANKSVHKNRYSDNENTVMLTRSNTQPANFDKAYFRESRPVRNKDGFRVGPSSEEIYSQNCSSDVANRESVTPEITNDDVSNEEHEDNERFTKSVGAKQNTSRIERIQPEKRHLSRESEKKREESMKRLLEWKQKMLQSPLNGKIQGSRKQQELFNNYKDTRYMSHNPLKHVNSYLEEKEYRKNVPQYNSYSSDDEENEKRSKGNVHSQAGWTLDTFSSNSSSPIPAQTTSTTILSSFKEPKKALTQLSELHNLENKNIFENVIDDNYNAITNPPKESTNVTNMRSETSDKFKSSPVVVKLKSNGALVKSILATIDKMSDNEDIDETNVGPNIEEDYITMASKHNVLVPGSNTTSATDTLLNESETDENQYVVMTENAVKSLLAPSVDETDRNDQELYEIVCLKEGRFEPVYVELKPPEHDNANSNQDDLPDILILPKRIKPGTIKFDSSDADDEDSKDLDSLDTQSQPRFSLSDNFRPASYYLDTSQVTTDFQDSSDSELVSPPPIPSSSPPQDADENCTLSTGPVQRHPDQFFETSKNSRFAYRKITKCNTLDSDKQPCNNELAPVEKRGSILSFTDDSALDDKQATEYKSILRRKPVSDEFYNELEFLDTAFNQTEHVSDLHIRSSPNNGTDFHLRSNNQSPQIPYHVYENLMPTDYSATVNIDKLKTLRIPLNNVTKIRRSSPIISEIEKVQMNTPDLNISSQARSDSQNSNCSVPGSKPFNSLPNQDNASVSMDISDETIESSDNFGLTAPPYYYSDLSVNAPNKECTAVLPLNNQRCAINGNKRDITRIINPIKNEIQTKNLSNILQINSIEDNTSMAQPGSLNFLTLTDKSDNIDKKNIFESDTLKRNKTTGTTDPKTKNFYSVTTTDLVPLDPTVRRSHSLDGLLENVLNENLDHGLIASDRCESTHDNQKRPSASEGSYLWEEDSIWRERLRSASRSHTKSMEDLGTIWNKRKTQKRLPRVVTRDVTYVNDKFLKLDKHNQVFENKKTLETLEINKKGSIVMDREKLRQWDLLSSAPSGYHMPKKPDESVVEGNNIVVELGKGADDTNAITDIQQPASGSVSINPRENEQINRDTFPRAKKIWTPKSQVESRSVTNLCSHSGEQHGVNNTDHLNKTSGPSDLSSESKKEHQYPNNTMNISAGDLLGRTHEELVLLLIQLRRQSANSLQAIENCYNEVNNIQYEKGKPLVNLVDQMVKLGSLYRVPKDRSNVGLCLSDRVQFNQQIQERRLLDEEKRQWNKVDPNHFHLQEKVQQLYQLDQLIHEKSSTLQNLKQDKEDTECALGNLRHRLSKGFNSPAEIEQAHKQQLLLENKLSWVHLMLAQNSKKLDETIAMNARLEQELLVLKQKLQTTRQHKTSHQCLDAANVTSGNTNNSALLDSNLQRLQYKIGELQKQRQELSKQVRQLTDRPNNFPPQKYHSPAWQNSQCYLDRTPSLWRETDPDTMNNGEFCKNNSSVNSYTSPLYINTDVKQLEETDLYNRSLISSNSTSDNVSNNSNIFQEKQEIKTVRIVKRESENRQSAKEKIKFDQRLGELEDDSSQNSSVLFRPMSVQKPAQTTSIVSSNNVLNYDELNAHDSVPNPKLCTEEEESSTLAFSSDKTSELSPVFKSDAAQQIITDFSNKSSVQQSRRRIVPKEKRRHYTAPNNSSQILPTDNKIITNDRRARDDLDMERALRQKIDAPDIVRSTLSHKELKYNENTIDNILGTPNKINIPERYIPEELPKLSAEEKEYRSRRVESIKKMLYDTAILSSNYTNSTAEEQTENTTNCTKQDATSKMTKEKKQREHLLQLNQILAEQVMEMSKVVAVKALAKLPGLRLNQMSTEEEDSSPSTPLPIYQQRENFYC